MHGLQRCRFETVYHFIEPIGKDRSVLVAVLGNSLGSKNAATCPFCTLLRSMLAAEELASEELHKYKLRAFAIPLVLRSILCTDKWEGIRTYGNVILALISEWDLKNRVCPIPYRNRHSYIGSINTSSPQASMNWLRLIPFPHG